MRTSTRHHAMAAPPSPPRRRVLLFPYHLTPPLALAVLIASRTTTALTTTSADDADAEAANNRTVTIALGVGFGAFFLAVAAFYVWRRRVDQQHGLKRAATLASQALPRAAPMQAAMPPSPGVMKPPAPVYQQEKQFYVPPYSPTSAVSKSTATAVSDGAYGAPRMGLPPAVQAPASLGGYGQQWPQQQEIQQQPPMHQQQQQMRGMYAGSNVGSGPASSLVGSTVVGSAANAPNKRISSLIADKNVSLKDLLRASHALDASEVAAITNNTPSPAPSTVVPGALLTESPAASLQRNDGARYRATRNYNASMADELPLRIGDIVEVVQVYDDGWAFAFLVDSGRPGVVPMSFLEKLPPPPSAQQNSFPPARRQPMNKRPSAPSASAPVAMSSVPAQPTASAITVQQQPAPRAAQARDTVMIYEDDDDDDDETETGSPATPPVIDRGLPSPTTARPPTTPTTPTTPMNVYHSPSQSRPAVRQPASPASATAKTTDIDTLMSVLSQIAKTDRASRLLTDLRLDFSNPAAARASVMHQIDEETRAGATPESKKKNRVSLSALLHALPPHAADDPTAVANAWIKGAPPVPNAGAGARNAPPPARNVGAGAPPRAVAARAPAPARNGAPPRSAMRSASSARASRGNSGRGDGERSQQVQSAGRMPLERSSCRT
ncbi:hypothetical protein AMAG_14414 [Allomyces macrogynus ATCC 38327]|uniref:SH3 domain-containing protein n=1 Tax=Allomyces macrogynus (strain ATCC 38327) TaxID=578462 RepID=A0A0L0T686_ALLM3|nr:hypothetical protein AMAG_14414 [Allomyces macrogynus ATCC 38327]|eukprot:KNE70265.1 hypothetical protein AMAG_14414 [Allomyces macrogynus ATCC 38327]